MENIEESESLKNYRQELLKDSWGEDSDGFKSLIALHKFFDETPQEKLEVLWSEIDKQVSNGPTVDEYFESLNPVFQYQKGYSDGAKTLMDKVITKLSEKEDEMVLIPISEVVILIKKIYDEE